MPKTKRNETCPCDSGIKYKKCCLNGHGEAQLKKCMEESKLGAYARTFNVMWLTAMVDTVNRICKFNMIPESIIKDPDWRTVLADYPDIQECYSMDESLQLPVGWTWTWDKESHIIGLFDQNQTQIYSKYLGIPKFTS